jgi:hypothetical protein
MNRIFRHGHQRIIPLHIFQPSITPWNDTHKFPSPQQSPIHINTTIPLAIFSTLDTCGAVKALLICQDMEDIVSTEGIDYAPD